MAEAAEVAPAPSTPATGSAATWFKPGGVANPLGRPKGSKNRLGEEFIRALADDFEAHGTGAIEAVRVERPHEYLKIIASILPKIIEFKSKNDGMSDDELRAAFIAAARELTAFGLVIDHAQAAGVGSGGAAEQALPVQAVPETAGIP